MDQVVIGILVLVFVIVLWKLGPNSPKEHAYLAAPDFQDSLVDKYRSYIKDDRGMTVNDYALESHVVNATPLSEDYKIL